MNETKDDLKREKVRIVPISNIEDFPDHPFQVKDDESMDALVESIRMNGVLNPVIALKIDENHYQLISGHRRKHACVLLGIDRIPLIGREMTKEEAVIEMVDSNLQREHILPSEKARAYKMKMDAMKKQGERRDLTSNPVGGKLKGIETAEIIGDEAGESANQVRRYEVALTRLEARVGSGMLSDITRGLIGVIRGDETGVYWGTLAIKFADYQRQALKREASKVPKKVRRLSMVLLVCFLLAYVVVIGSVLLESLGGLLA